MKAKLTRDWTSSPRLLCLLLRLFLLRIECCSLIRRKGMIEFLALLMESTRLFFLLLLSLPHLLSSRSRDDCCCCYYYYYYYYYCCYY